MVVGKHALLKLCNCNAFDATPHIYESGNNSSKYGDWVNNEDRFLNEWKKTDLLLHRIKIAIQYIKSTCAGN